MGRDGDVFDRLLKLLSIHLILTGKARACVRLSTFRGAIWILDLALPQLLITLLLSHIMPTAL